MMSEAELPDAPGYFRLQGGSRSGLSFDLTTDMGQVVARAEGFPDRASAEKAIKWMQRNIADCPIIDPPYTGPYIG